MPDFVIIWIHLVAVIALVGGLVFVRLVLRPALHGLAPESQQVEVLCRVGRRFRTLTWVSLILLIVTGAYFMLNESGSSRIETTWGVVLMVKLFVFAITFGLLLIHDFILDPYGSAPKSSSQLSNSSLCSIRTSLIQHAILLLTLGILFIACYLKSV